MSVATGLPLLEALHSTPARRYLSDTPVPEPVVRELLGLPEDAATMALVPLGHPARGRGAQPVRRPLEEVVHWGAWGTRRPRPEGDR